jgi:hypothetical protein
MKQDRFLTGILIGIVMLVLIALVMFYSRQDQQEYRPDDTPEGVVHNYALALFNSDYEKAYAYLAEGEHKPSYTQFRQSFFDYYINPSDAGIELGETEIEGDQAFINLNLIYSPSDPFSSGYRTSESARLERQNGEWKLLRMPYSFWDYGWYTPTPAPIPVP